MFEITKELKKYKKLNLIIVFAIQFSFWMIRQFCLIRPYKTENIVIISLHKLGDSICTIPAINVLIRQYKKKLIILCYPETKPLYEMSFKNIEYHILEHNQFSFDERYSHRSARKILAKIKPDTIYDFTGVMKAATLIFNSKAREIIGHNRIYFKTIYNVFTPIREKPHLMDIYLDIAELKFPLKNRIELKTFNCQIHKTSFILIHPLGGWEAKTWNLKKFINLAEELSNDYKVVFVVPDLGLNDEIKKYFNTSKVSYVTTFNINELIDLIKQCSVAIGNDTGTIHIASYLGKPTFTIYGPTNPVYHLPYGKNHRYIQCRLKCSPLPNEKVCFTFGGRIGCPSNECMNLLSAKDVVDNVYDFIHFLNIEKDINVSKN